MQSLSPDQDARQRSNRETALSEVLSSYVEPRAVSYRFVAAFVVVGLAGCVSLAWAASQIATQRPVRFEAGSSATLDQGMAAFNRGDWDEAERLLRQAATRSPEAAARLQDYAERLGLIRRDGERLARAEEALEANQPERALEQVALIGANSALFAQAEVLSRAARAQAEANALAQQAARLEAEAERQASRAAMARTFAPAPEAPPPRAPSRRHTERSAGRPGAPGTDEAW